MKRKIGFIIAAFSVIALSGAWAEGQKEGTASYPDRPINVIVHSSAGGGSDVWARKVSALMEKDLGVKMIVSNMAGGNGGVAANSVWNAAHDGYTVLGASETAMTYVVNGAFAKNADSWNFFISGGSPGVITVRKDSPYRTFTEFLESARKNPGHMKVANSGIGKLWHLKVVMMEKYANVPMKHSPYNGSAPALVALMSKEVDAVSCSAGEVAAYIESGEMRPLVMTELDGFEFKGFGKVPAVTDSLPELSRYLPMGQFLTLMVPKDIPAEATTRLGKAFDEAMRTSDMLEFINQQYATRIALWGDNANSMAKKMEQGFSWFMKDLDLVKVDPSTADIARP